MNKEDTRPPLPGAGTMENYTTPFLVVFGVILFVILLGVKATYGLPAALLLAIVSDRIIGRNNPR